MLTASFESGEPTWVMDTSSAIRNVGIHDVFIKLTDFEDWTLVLFQDSVGWVLTKNVIPA